MNDLENVRAMRELAEMVEYRLAEIPNDLAHSLRHELANALSTAYAPANGIIDVPVAMSTDTMLYHVAWITAFGRQPANIDAIMSCVHAAFSLAVSA